MTIAILSWAAPLTLRNTLESYARFGLDRLDEDKVIYFQEITEEDEKIASQFGWEAIGTSKNVGIATAYSDLVEYASGEFFLFLENDWELLSDPYNRILAGEILLSYDLVDVVRYRSRNNPGWPLWSTQFAFREHERPEYTLDAVHWGSDEHLEQNLHLERHEVHVAPDADPEPFWITSAQKANWTNNPHMAKTEFLKRVLLPRIQGDIEISLQGWWQQQDFRVAMGEGLFTHQRLDR